MSPRLERNPVSQKTKWTGTEEVDLWPPPIQYPQSLWVLYRWLLACFKTESPLPSQNWHQTFDLTSSASQGLRFYTCASTTGKFIFCACGVCMVLEIKQTQDRLYSRQVICLSAVFSVAPAQHTYTHSVLALTKHSNSVMEPALSSATTTAPSPFPAPPVPYGCQSQKTYLSSKPPSCNCHQ